MGNTLSAAESAAAAITTDQAPARAGQCPVDHAALKAQRSEQAAHQCPATGKELHSGVGEESERSKFRMGGTSQIPSGCPMHEDYQKDQAQQQEGNNNKSASDCSANSTQGPVHQLGLSFGKDYSGKLVDIDPLNNEGAPNQQPAPDQPFDLPTHRQVSSIPKSVTNKDENWVYPSAQMFWNAMLRKGWRWKDDDLKPKDMESIIMIHNSNNEATWREVLKWELMHYQECGNPKLKKFGGRANDISPRARIRSLLGYELPFDRHDWIVDRCGKDVRYIIDYYDGGDVDPHSKEFAILDVRPAMDSFENVWDRMVAAWWRWTRSPADDDFVPSVLNNRPRPGAPGAQHSAQENVET